MATHKSAEKRARQAIRRTKRNSQTKSSVKTAEKSLVGALQAKSKETETLLRAFTKKIMSAVSKGAIKKSTAARKISRLATRVSNQLNG